MGISSTDYVIFWVEKYCPPFVVMVEKINSSIQGIKNKASMSNKYPMGIINTTT